MGIGMLGPGVGAVDLAGEEGGGLGKTVQAEQRKTKIVQLACTPPDGEDPLVEFRKTCEVYTVSDGASLLHNHPQAMQVGVCVCLREWHIIPYPILTLIPPHIHTLTNL